VILSRAKNIALGLALVALAGCSFDYDTPSGQGSVSQSTAGSGTNTGAGTAALTWQVPTENTNGTPLTDLAGYTIVYGTTPDALSNSVQVTDIETTSYVVKGLGQGTWYFAIMSNTSSGETSTLSSIESTTIT
jgi:hypothetical protein